MIASVLVSTRRRDCLHQTPIQAQPPRSGGAGPQDPRPRNWFVPSCRPIHRVDSSVRRPRSVDIRGRGRGRAVVFDLSRSWDESGAGAGVQSQRFAAEPVCHGSWVRSSAHGHARTSDPGWFGSRGSS